MMFYDEKNKIFVELLRFCFVFHEFHNFHQNTFDFHLKNNSICNNYGDPNIIQSTPLLTHDLEGVLRDNSPDLGALENLD